MSADINFSAFSGHQSQRRVRYIESEINQDKVVNTKYLTDEQRRELTGRVFHEVLSL